MKIKSILLSSFLFVVSITSVFAGQVKMGTFNAGSGGNYRFDPQGSIGVDLSGYAAGKSTDGTWFGTYCIQKNEYFTPGNIYDVVVNDRSVKAGVNNNQNNVSDGYDIISVGTAYLYGEFAKGTLVGFNYGLASSAADLQNWFWYLENEQTNQGSSTFGNLLVAQFGSISNSMVNYTGNEVKVLNLTTGGLTSPTVYNQDQLVYVGVSDNGSVVAMLGLTMIGLMVVRRKVSV